MTIALVQSRSGSANDSFGSNDHVNLAYSSNVAAGNLLVVCGLLSNPKTMRGTVTDSQGNTWTAATTAVESADTGATSIQIYYAVAGSSAANTITYTATGHNSDSGSVYGVRIFEFSGCASASPLDAGNQATAVTSGNSLSLTVATTNSLVVAVAVNSGGNGDVTPQTNYTAGPTPRSQYGLDNTEYRVDAPSGANAIKFDNAAANYNGALAAAAFKPGAAATSIKRLLTLSVG
jgi:hypothetical protein